MTIETVKEKSAMDILNEYKEGKIDNPENGLTNLQFIQLCNEENLDLSYSAYNWAKDKLITILPGSYARKGVTHNKEVSEAIEAIFIALCYPDDIETEIEYGKYSKNVKEYFKGKLNN